MRSGQLENDISELCRRGLGTPPVGSEHLPSVRFVNALKELVMTHMNKDTTAADMRIMGDHLATIGTNVLRLTDKRLNTILRIEDRFETWHDFDPNLHDGSQLRYPSSHIDSLPVGSKAALLHFRVASAVKEAYNALVTDKKKIKGYWETGDRDDWHERELMSEILPTYLESMEERDDRGFIVDIPDMLEAMISTAEFFTPEAHEPNDDDDASDDDDDDEENKNKKKVRYFFELRSERKALVALREKHLAVLRAIMADIKK